LVLFSFGTSHLNCCNNSLKRKEQGEKKQFKGDSFLFSFGTSLASFKKKWVATEKIKIKLLQLN